MTLKPLTRKDIVFVEGYQVEASVGVFDWEKEIKQLLIFDLELETDFTKAAQSDAIDDAVDYASVCEHLSNIVNQAHYQLLETLADKIVKSLFSSYSISTIRLKIRKPGAVPEAKSVGVEVEYIS